MKAFRWQRLLGAVVVATALSTTAYPEPVFYGPLPYLSESNSPFTPSEFEYFYLEDFEDGMLDTPGVSASPAWSVFTSGSYRDSVDGDDGIIDGDGGDGRSFISNFQDDPLVFTFSAIQLGGNLPTHAGVVWTDIGRNGGGDGPGSQPVYFAAFDEHGVSLGEIGPYLLGDTEITGQTSEDRFFGVSSPGGISAIQIRMPQLDNWEVDHVQYGLSTVIFEDGFESGDVSRW